MLGIPEEWRTKLFNGKYLVKEAFGNILPDDYLSAPKRGFIIPYRQWLHGSLKKDVVELCSSEYTQNQGIFNTNVEEQLIKPYYNGKEILQPLVWTVYMFQHWWNLHRN